jgi:hypothetical protein
MSEDQKGAGITASWKRQRMDLRLIRAQRLTAAIVDAIAPHLDPSEPVNLGHVSRAILEVLHGQGVEVLTDYDRAEMGLPPRDELGWRPDEIIAHDNRMLEPLMRPLPYFIPTRRGNTD